MYIDIYQYIYRRQSGHDGIAPLNAISVRRYPKYKLRIFTQENTPRGSREGGRMRSPIGRTYRKRNRPTKGL